MGIDRLFLLFTIFFVPSTCLVGQLISEFYHLNTEQGLASPKYNNFVHQDGFGLVWVSSISGVYQFDGNRVKAYHAEEENPHSILNEVGIQSEIYEDRRGDLWFAGAFRLSRYNRLTDDFNHFYQLDLAGDTIRTLYRWCYVDAENDVLFSNADRKLFVGDAREPSKLTLLDDIFVGNQDFIKKIDDHCYRLVKLKLDTNKIILLEYCDFQKSSVQTLIGPPGVKVNEAVYGKDETLWVATTGGVFKIENGREAWQRVLSPSFPDEVDATAIAVASNGNVVIGTKSDGLFVHEVMRQRIAPLLQNNGSKTFQFEAEVTCLKIDKDDNLWVSTGENGVFYTSLVSRKFGHLPFIESDNSAVALAEDKEGSLYVLFPDRVERMKGEETVTYPLPKLQGAFDRANSLFVDDDKRIWVGTYSTLYVKKLEGVTFTESVFCPSNELACRAGVNGVVGLDNGNLLIATNTEFVYEVSADLTSHTPWSKAFQSARFIEFGREGLALASTNNDSLLLMRKSGNGYEIDTAFLHQGLVNRCIYDERIGGFWIANYGGIKKLIKGAEGNWELSLIPKTKGEVIASMEQDGGGSLWFATPGYLKRYFPENDSLAEYTLSDGLQGSNFNLMSSLKRADGTIAFGGTNGVTTVDGKNLESRVGPASPIIVDVLVKGERYEEMTGSGRTSNNLFLEKLDLPFARNSIEIQVSAGEYSDPKNCRLFYSILAKGEDVDFKELGKDNKIVLERLSEGYYTLRLWAMNADGKKSSAVRTLEINIDPPWRRSALAYVLYTLLALGVGFVLYAWRVRAKRRREKEELRTAQAEALASERETVVLRLQMNPHFIFNSLNSVNHFITSKNKAEAQSYLGVFSKMIRTILDRSSEPLTRLDDEIEFLEEYIEGERMRLGSELRYEIDDDGADAFSTFIPTMILQPFVENAIWHGIGGRPQGGLITIRFTEDEAAGQLIAEVQDNGKGREEASKQQRKDHESKAMSITERRLKLLNQQSLAPAAAPGNARYQIIDLEENGVPQGTLVRIHLPLIFQQP